MSAITRDEVETGAGNQEEMVFDPAHLLSPRLSEACRAVMDALASGELFAQVPAQAPAPAQAVIPQMIGEVGPDAEEAALQEMAVRLTDLNRLALQAANTGVASAAQIAANQYEVDALVAAVWRKGGSLSCAGVLPKPQELGACVENGETFALADLMSGGRAELSARPALALRIVRRAQEEVAFGMEELEMARYERMQGQLMALESTVESILRTGDFLRDAQEAIALVSGARDDSQMLLAAQSVGSEEDILMLLSD